MNLKKILTKDSVRIRLTGTTKNEIIRELVEFISAQNGALDSEALLAAVLDREAQMSTGMKNGIAIPHGKTDTVSRLYAAVGVSAEPIEFQSLDKQPARIFIMTISPASRTGPHLQFLAEISRILTQETLREKILAAKSSRELLAILLGESC